MTYLCRITFQILQIRCLKTINVFCREQIFLKDVLSLVNCNFYLVQLYFFLLFPGTGIQTRQITIVRQTKKKFPKVNQYGKGQQPKQMSREKRLQKHRPLGDATVNRLMNLVLIVMMIEEKGNFTINYRQESY